MSTLVWAEAAQDKCIATLIATETMLEIRKNGKLKETIRGERG